MGELVVVVMACVGFSFQECLLLLNRLETGPSAVKPNLTDLNASNFVLLDSQWGAFGKRMGGKGVPCAVFGEMRELQVERFSII